MQVKTLPLGPLETNCHIASAGGRAIAVDPGGDPADVLNYLAAEGLTLDAILVTHFHFDHIYGNRALSEATGVKIMAGTGDAPLLETELGGGGFMGMPKVEPFEYTPLEEGRIELLGQSCDVIATPGHSAGSLSFHFPDAGVIFVGDVIFYRSIGRTDFPGGDIDVLKRSVSEKIFALPDATVIYPGHGPETSVGDEKAHNPFFSAFR